MATSSRRSQLDAIGRASGYLWKERDAIAALNRADRAAIFAAEIKKVTDAIRRLSDAELFEIVRQTGA